MSSGNPIFKNHKIQDFVTICEKSFFEISNFIEQNHLITKAYAWRNRLMQKLTLFLLDSGRYGSNVKTYPTTQCKFLLILKMGVPVFIGAS